MKTLALVVLILFAALHVHSQGLVSGYMLGSGKSTVALSLNTEWYQRYYVGAQQTYNPGLGTITTTSVSLYAASGLTDWADVIVNLPYVTASSSAGYWASVSNIQDAAFAVRLRPIKLAFEDGGLDVMVSGGVSTPVANYPTDTPVTIGHGANSIDGHIIAQYRAWNGMFVMAQIGYIGKGTVQIDRGDKVDVPDQIHSVVRAGMAHGSWYADGWLENFTAQSGTFIVPGVPFPTNAQNMVRVGATVAYRIWSEFSVVVNAASVLSGTNIGHAARLGGGIVYDLPVWQGM